VTPDPVPAFHKILTPGPDLGPKETQNPAEVDSGTPDPWPPLMNIHACLEEHMREVIDYVFCILCMV